MLALDTASLIAGNCPDEQKRLATDAFDRILTNESFGSALGQSMKLTSIDQYDDPDGVSDSKIMKIVFDLTIASCEYHCNEVPVDACLFASLEAMCDVFGCLRGGSVAFIVEV